MGGTELNYVKEAFDTNWLSTVGPNLSALEHEFSKMVNLPAVALGSGTAGIHLGLKLLGVQPHDEVLTPTLTFAACCNPILYEHARPVFIDSERKTWNLDADILEEFLKKRAAVNRLPKVLIVVHLFGQCADLDPLMEVSRRYGLSVLEDAAESLGASYKDRVPGTLGDVGVFSFNGNKIITSSGGGMLVSQRKDWVDRARHWSTQARDTDPLGLGNYVHSELGYNYRMSNVLAGIARGQLEVLELRVQQRRSVFSRYVEGFRELPGIAPQPETFPHTRWLSCFLIDKSKFGMSAADLIRFLDTANVEARPVWKPMHTQPLYRHYECIGGEVAEDLNKRGICLPSSSSLSEEDQDFVIDQILQAFKQKTP
jgi:pyridoxal phosphate-dependent aminotransferase EpsN